MAISTILLESERIETSSPLGLSPRPLRFLLSLFTKKKSMSGVLTDLELRAAIETFRATHSTRTATDELLVSWRVLRKSLSLEQFSKGCRRYLEDGTTYFPKPSDIKRLSRAPVDRGYTEPVYYRDSLEPDTELPPFDKAAFRQTLRDLAGIDLDGPRPITPKRQRQ